MKARDEVNVKVRHRLACGGAVVDADVETIGLELRFCRRLGLIEQFQQGSTLLLTDLKKRPHMAFGNDQAMTGRNGKAIADQTPWAF